MSQRQITKLPDINMRPQSVKKKNLIFYQKKMGKAQDQDEIVDFQSPFKLPTDEEVFLFRENERQKKQEQKEFADQLRIWEKKTAANRTQLKHYKNFETVQNEKFVPKTAYNTKEKKVIQEALEIARERQKNRENGIVKEPIVNLLEQKKEMFLVTMAHGIIEDEIKKLKETADEKQMALEVSQKQLETDHENFQKYLENNKQQKLEAETRAEAEIKEKKSREAEIKSLNIKLTSLRAEKTRNEEAVANFKEHKDFLDKLAPKEWNDQKERRRKERIMELRDQFISQQLEKLSEFEEQEAPEGKQGRRERESYRPKRAHLEQKNEFDKQFQKQLETGQIDEIDEFDDDYEMFFKTSQQLVEMFNDLEERNLFLVQTTQEAEQNLEQLKTYFSKTKSDQDFRIKNLIQTKEMLKKNYDNVCTQIKNLQIRGNEKDMKKDNKDLRKQIIDVYEQFQAEMPGGSHDHQNKATLDILVAIELYLEKQLKSLRGLPPKQVEYWVNQLKIVKYFQRQICERDWKVKQREEHNERIKEEGDRRIQNNLNKIMQPSKKRVGRQVMYRSKPFDKVEVEKEKSVDNEELEDMKYFME